jgi:hypothetical protein
MATTQASEIRLAARKHPCLFLNDRELDQIRELASDQTTYQHRRMAEIRRNAEAWLRAPMAIPARGADGSLTYVCFDDGHEVIYDPSKPHEHICPQCGKVHRGEPYDGWWRAMSHHRIAYTARDLALAYALDGEERYAREAARILLTYANLYPLLPVHNLSKLGRESLDEVRLALALAPAYDLICNSNLLGTEEKQRVESDLFLGMARLIQVGHGLMLADRVGGGVSNFQATMTVGVGVLGLLLGNIELVEFAINGPVGFNRLIRDGVLENGLWWEGAVNYSNAVVGWLMYLTEAAWHAGIDLYGNERFGRMFRAPLRLVFPDGTLPATNDGPFDVSLDYLIGFAEVYYTRVGDSEVEAVLTPGQVMGTTEQNAPFDLGLWLKPTWTPARSTRQASVDFRPSFAILRSDPGAEPIDILLDYGPHGDGHGHSDLLNLILYANGRLQAADLGVCNYRLPEREQWYLQSVSHNTVAVDERSLHPGGGRLNFFYVSPRAKVADASPVTDCHSGDGPSGIPRIRRTVALLDDAFVVDILRVQQGKVYDWVYHNFGALHSDEPLAPHDGALGAANGYQYITNVRRGQASGDSFAATWSSDGQGVKLTMLGVEDMEIVTGEGPGAASYWHGIAGTVPLVLVRSMKADTVYKAVLEPFRGQPAISAVEELPVANVPPYPAGSFIRGCEGVGLEIAQSSGTRHNFLLSYAWGLKRFGDIDFNGQLAYLSFHSKAHEERGMPDYVFAAHTSELERGGFCLRADKMTTLSVARADAGEYLLTHQGDVEARIEMAGEAWAAAKVGQLDSEGEMLGAVDAHIADGLLRFTVLPQSRYAISCAA